MPPTIVPASPDARQEADLDPGLDLRGKIDRLRREMKAVILAHYYQDSPIQDLADFVGDSLDLSRRAASTDAQVIVFAGVRFMAETAKILSPERLVLLPDAEAGCSLETACPAEEFRAFRQSHPEHQAVTYINCSAEVKAASDVIVTSSNALAIVKQLDPHRPVLFAPDRNLGSYIARRLGRELTLWPGACEVHEAFSLAALTRLRQEHPRAAVAAHPECPQILLDLADHIGSTRSLLDFAASTPAEEIIVVTEPHLLHQMRQLAPGKRLLPLMGRDGDPGGPICPYMARNTLAKLYLCMLNQAPRVEMPAELMDQARRSLQRMLDMSPPAR
ncbi:MAG: quinolinate synthase NadA [Deltaproteobacteria bacterium]|nr:quinolinate synthase NadA [Deltaproteobacteria bacterium]